MKKIIYLLTFSLLTRLYAQDPFYLEDLNPNSESYGQIVSPADFLGDICIVFFGHES
jgi:hypothetical protein